MGFPLTAPAPLVYRPGEGWTYEPESGGRWRRSRAKDQLDVAKEAFESEKYNLALKAARHTVRTWPLSDYAPEAQYLVGRAYEAKKQDQRAFREYQKLMTQYPKATNYTEVLQRQFEIATRFLDGQWFKLWGYIPFFPSMEKTSEMYGQLIQSGPYSSVAPQAQINIGTARERQELYPKAVQAYERAADRYHDQPAVAAEAMFKAGLAYHKQAKRAEYDQNAAKKAITVFTDFMALYPKDARVAQAEKLIIDLKTEQARGNLEIARYYEKKRRWDGALVYYNEVVSKDPGSQYSDQAKERIDAIKRRTGAVQQTAQR